MCMRFFETLPLFEIKYYNTLYFLTSCGECLVSKLLQMNFVIKIGVSQGEQFILFCVLHPLHLQ